MTSVYDSLVELVFSDAFSPGQRLIERDLAARLGVSRIPLRESITRLVAESMLVREGRQRTQVRLRAYTNEEVRDLYRYRLALEAANLEMAVAAAQPSDFQQLERTCKQADGLIHAYRSVRRARLDHQFHLQLAEASHNERMITLIRNVLIECHYAFFIRPTQQRRPQWTDAQAEPYLAFIAGQHRQIVQSLRARDLAGAQRLMRAHLAPPAQVNAVQSEAIGV